MLLFLFWSACACTAWGAVAAPPPEKCRKTYERFLEAIARGSIERAVSETDTATQRLLRDADGAIPPGVRVLVRKAKNLPFESIRFADEFGEARIANLPALFDDFFPFQGELGGFWETVRVRWLYGFREPLRIVIPDGAEGAGMEAVEEDLRGRARRNLLPDARLLEVLPASRASEGELASSHVVLAGTPGANPVLSGVLPRLPVEFHGEAIGLVDRSEGYLDNVGAALTVPNPWNPRLAMLVLTGTSEGAIPPLVRQMDAPWDFVLVRGDRPLTAGAFDHGAPDWRGIARLVAPAGPEPDWTQIQTAHLAVLLHPSSRLLAARWDAAVWLEDGVRRAEERLGGKLPGSLFVRIWPSAAEKNGSTGNARPLVIDPVAREIDQVFDGPVEGLTAYPVVWLALRIAWGGGSDALLGGIAAHLVRDTFPVDIEEAAGAVLSGREGVGLDPDALFVRDPGGRVLLASFVGRLAAEKGMPLVERWYRESATGSLREAYARASGSDPDAALRAWAGALAGGSRAASGGGGVPAGLAEKLRERRDREVYDALAGAVKEGTASPASRALFARAAYRLGHYEEALASARDALRAGVRGETAAWAHLDAGRSLVLLGRQAEAAPDLGVASLLGGDGRGPGLVARYWLDRLGIAGDLESAIAGMEEGAEEALRSLRRGEAAGRLEDLLAIDPYNPRAHALLSSVYEEMDRPLAAIEEGEAALTLGAGAREATPLRMTLGRAYALRHRVFVRQNSRAVLETYVDRCLEFWTGETDYAQLPDVTWFLGTRDLLTAEDHFEAARSAAESAAEVREAELLGEVTGRARRELDRYFTVLSPLRDVRVLVFSGHPSVGGDPTEKQRVLQDQQTVRSLLPFLEQMIREVDRIENELSRAGVGSPEGQDMQQFDAKRLLDRLVELERRADFTGVR